MADNIYLEIISKRSEGLVFSVIRKELIQSKRYDEQLVNKAIGKIHDHEAEILSFSQTKKKNYSLLTGSLIVLFLSLGYTILTLIDESLPFIVLLYGPILGGFAGAALGFEKARAASNQLSLLDKKFN